MPAPGLPLKTIKFFSISPEAVRVTTIVTLKVDDDDKRPLTVRLSVVLNVRPDKMSKKFGVWSMLRTNRKLWLGAFSFGRSEVMNTVPPGAAFVEVVGIRE